MFSLEKVMDVNNLQEMRVIELKKELEIRGLSKSGSKKELVERLKNVSLCVCAAELRSLLNVAGSFIVKSKAQHLYSALHGTNHFKALRHGSHSFTCHRHHACLTS